MATTRQSTINEQADAWPPTALETEKVAHKNSDSWLDVASLITCGQLVASSSFPWRQYKSVLLLLNIVIRLPR